MLRARVGLLLTAREWSLPDPKHLDDDGYRAVRDDIAHRVSALLEAL